VFIQLRKIRHSLLSDTKTKKYILYACGEILLVVAGILIALQVNNQNIRAQAKLVERQFYQTMQVQLVEDKELINDERYGITDRIDSYVIGMKYIVDNDHEQLEDLAAKVYLLLEYGDFRRKSSVYQTLIYSGEITYIKNKDILKSLQELERTYQFIERIEATQANFVMSHTAPAINEILDFESGELVIPNLVFTRSFKNNFFLAIRLASEKNQELEYALSVIDHTLKAIDDELGLTL